MRMRARFGAESGRENYRNPLESQATVTDVKNTTWNMESQTDNEFCKENNVRRYVSFVHFSSRFPLFDRNKVEDEKSFSLHISLFLQRSFLPVLRHCLASG